MPISQFMATALHDPDHGYYSGHAAPGIEGDFITAPEISPVFCALVCEWAVKTAIGSHSAKEALHFIELGPGRGKLAAGLAFACRNAGRDCQLTLVECDPILRAEQETLLKKMQVEVRWVEDTSMLPEGPAVVLANEFIDCIPIRQFIFHKNSWRERIITLDPQDPTRLVFGLGRKVPQTLIPAGLTDPQPGDLVETRDLVDVMLSSLVSRLGEHKATLLFIDYGSFETVVGDTLQAVKQQKKIDPLTLIGQADLTACVDFGELIRLANKWRFSSYGPVTQREGLERMGLEAAMEDMRKNLDRKQFMRLLKGVDRVADQKQMGHLFKMLLLTTPDTPPPPDFEDLANG